jgi:outer membrane lipoprotein SlyB
MAPVVRVLSVSLLAGGLAGGVSMALVGKGSDGPAVSLFLACVGAIIGAIAGRARENAMALRQKPWI